MFQQNSTTSPTRTPTAEHTFMFSRSPHSKETKRKWQESTDCFLIVADCVVYFPRPYPPITPVSCVRSGQSLSCVTMVRDCLHPVMLLAMWTHACTLQRALLFVRHLLFFSGSPPASTTSLLRIKKIGIVCFLNCYKSHLLSAMSPLVIRFLTDSRVFKKKKMIEFWFFKANVSV